MNYLGDKIRRARAEKGLSQERLARLTDVTTRTIANIEAGANLPRVDTARRLAEVLGIDLGDLLAEGAA